MRCAEVLAIARELDQETVRAIILPLRSFVDDFLTRNAHLEARVAEYEAELGGGDQTGL